MSVMVLSSVRSRFLYQSLISEIIVSTSRGYASRTKHSTPKRISTAISPNTSSSKLSEHAERKLAVNPPASTLPPLLDPVERQSDQSTIQYYFSIGKSYIKFYKTALKAVWTNNREARAIISRIPSEDSQGHSIKYLDALRTGLLTRAEFQFIIRSRKDIKKLPLVGLLVAICGEFTPLLVVFVSGIIPRTAWIPKQVHRARVNTEKRREESFRQGTVETQTELKRISASKGIEGLSPAQILHVSRALGLHSTLWEKLWNSPPQWIARIKVHRALEYLEADDSAIQRDGGVQSLSDAETERACEERGLDVLKYNVGTLRSRMELYMEFRIKEKVSVAAIALVRPSNWEKLA